MNEKIKMTFDSCALASPRLSLARTHSLALSLAFSELSRACASLSLSLCLSLTRARLCSLFLTCSLSFLLLLSRALARAPQTWTALPAWPKPAASQLLGPSAAAPCEGDGAPPCLRRARRRGRSLTSSWMSVRTPHGANLGVCTTHRARPGTSGLSLTFSTGMRKRSMAMRARR